MQALTNLMNIMQHASGHANHQYLEITPRPMLDAAGHIDDDALVQLKFGVVDSHAPLTCDDVINLVGVFVIVEGGIGDLQMMHLGGGAVVLVNERTNQSASLSPGLYVGRIATDKRGGRVHRGD